MRDPTYGFLMDFPKPFIQPQGHKPSHPLKRFIPQTVPRESPQPESLESQNRTPLVTPSSLPSPQANAQPSSRQAWWARGNPHNPSHWNPKPALHSFAPFAPYEFASKTNESRTPRAARGLVGAGILELLHAEQHLETWLRLDGPKKALRPKRSRGPGPGD